MGSFINNGRFNKARPVAAMAVFSTGSGKGPDLLIRAADGRFHIVPCKELISARPSHFLSRAGKAKACQPQWSFYQSRRPFYQGRPASMAVLSTMTVLARPRIRPVAAIAVLSTRSGQMARSLDLARRWSRVSSLSAIFMKGWQSRWPFIKTGQPQWPFYQSQWPFYQARAPQWPFYQQWPLYQGRPNARWPLYQGQWPLYQGVIKEDAYILGHLSTGFRVIQCRASLSLARHVQWLHARARLAGGSLRVASPAIGGSARLPPPAELRVVALGAHSPWFAPRFV